MDDDVVVDGVVVILVDVVSIQIVHLCFLGCCLYFEIIMAILSLLIMWTECCEGALVTIGIVVYISEEFIKSQI